MPTLILEGTDGSGKTTIAQLLEAKTDGIVIKNTPHEVFGKLQRLAETRAEKHQWTYFTYHLLATAYSYLKAKRYIEDNPNKTVIFDRSVYSTLAVQLSLDEFFNNGKNGALIQKISKKLADTFAKPDLVVLLDAEEKERQLRLHRRDNAALSDSEVKFAEVLRRNFDCLLPKLLKDSTNFSKIDTVGSTPENVANYIKMLADSKIRGLRDTDSIKKLPDLKVARKFGAVSKDSNPVFLLWAHTKPKQIYTNYIMTSDILFNKLPVAVIDDIAPKIIENRSSEEQEKITTEFEDFFKSKGCKTVLLSNIFDAEEFMKIASEIKIARFLHALPKNSLENVADGDEKNHFIHFISNMYTFKIALKYGDTIISSTKNEGIFFAFYELYKKMKLEEPIGALFLKHEST